MLSCLARPRLGRVTNFMARTQTKRSFLWKRWPSNSQTYIAAAALINMPGL
ncbi:hypothetical protein PDIG_80730 [Penicillium digitatum PHI26]|uniref:Uncharacterized protein n=2 Tax=Penicillium digitatum TaxID=36651 RepID=K9FXY3_PEND2|nr:hypothetical protein PDIP_29120 [Penicillium digitatum Pd1]EKV05876.1 hypothetical protein PDIG_80730 [Penicillium digitatum PHI26]EKV17934.1 hypothetical protein PDIP_29120 [Penicillium digitatum Pd1]